MTLSVVSQLFCRTILLFNYNKKVNRYSSILIYDNKHLLGFQEGRSVVKDDDIDYNTESNTTLISINTYTSGLF